VWLANKNKAILMKKEKSNFDNKTKKTLLQQKSHAQS